jgi:hypothetical protein
LSGLALAIETDDADLDIAFRREVFHEANSTRRAVIAGITAAQAARCVHDKHDVEVTHATDRRGNAFDVNTGYAAFHGVASGWRLDFDL